MDEVTDIDARIAYLTACLDHVEKVVAEREQ